LQEGNVRCHQIIAAAALMLLCAVATGHAEKRVALVVGNAAYRHADKLANPVNDARGMRDALKNLGFDVTYGEDLDQKGLRRAIGQFADRVGDADVAMVYFAGHGATFGDTPYVVPVDAEFSSLGQVAYELVPVETLIGELRQAKGVRIVILDACRDNAAEQELKRQASRGGPAMRGLAPMKNPGGLIIAYATQYLSTAADDAGGASTGGLFSWASSSTRHSPFTAALLNNIATPGLDVKDMFYKVGRDVVAATEGKQRPEISISMYDQYALVPGGGGGVAPPPAAGPADGEMTWSIVKDTRDAEQLRRFVSQFPSSPRRREAEQRIKALEQTNVAALPARPEEKPPGPAPSAPMPAAAAAPQAATPPAAPALLPWPVPEPSKPAPGPQTAAVAPPVTPAVPAAGPCGGPVTAAFPSRCAAPLTQTQERGLKPKDIFRECENCPEMVVVPAGSFTMGSPASEKDRDSDEGPQHIVTISQRFAVGKLHATVDQFAAFVKESGYRARRCVGVEDDCNRPDRWRNPDLEQEGSHPVVHVSWDDANAYANWLAKKTGKPYRLLSEAEWEYAARSRTSPGTYPRFWFGNDEKDLCRYGNGTDQKARDRIHAYSNEGAKNWLVQRGGDWAFLAKKGWPLRPTENQPVAPCNDGYAYTSPAGHYQPNDFGLYDMAGNASQWTADCYHDGYDGAPADGSAWTTDCDDPHDGHVVRGGSWFSDPVFLRAARRDRYPGWVASGGFRLARTLISAGSSGN
jgi:formylglycine-generating enzyme required for sulfatase activity